MARDLSSSRPLAPFGTAEEATGHGGSTVARPEISTLRRDIAANDPPGLRRGRLREPQVEAGVAGRPSVGARLRTTTRAGGPRGVRRPRGRAAPRIGVRASERGRERGGPRGAGGGRPSVRSTGARERRRASVARSRAAVRSGWSTGRSVPSSRGGEGAEVRARSALASPAAREAGDDPGRKGRSSGSRPAGRSPGPRGSRRARR